MKIGNVSRGKAAGPAKRTKGAAKAGASAFSDELKAAAGPAAVAPTTTDGGIVETGGVEGVEAILAMQEVPGDPEQEAARKKAKRYGDDLLEKMLAIQDGLLAGGIPKSALMEIAHNIRAGRAQVDDPKLNEILDEIELRAEIEIAKYTR